jgi:hypothetical protein
MFWARPKSAKPLAAANVLGQVRGEIDFSDLLRRLFAPIMMRLTHSGYGGRNLGFKLRYKLFSLLCYRWLLFGLCACLARGHTLNRRVRLRPCIFSCNFARAYQKLLSQISHQPKWLDAKEALV